ncbi:MAG: hypothetical protein PUG36_05705 [Clostridiales bacterium]|nr:hypothetical protein [Clostridiales bacterium]
MEIYYLKFHRGNLLQPFEEFIVESVFSLFHSPRWLVKTCENLSSEIAQVKSSAVLVRIYCGIRNFYLSQGLKDNSRPKKAGEN